MGSQSGLQGTRPAAAAVLGISPAAELSLLGSQMHTSNHSVCHPCSNRVSATSRTAVYGPVRTIPTGPFSRLVLSGNAAPQVPPVPEVSPPFREVTIWASKKCHSVGSRIAAFLWVGVDICLSRGRRVKLPDRATRRPGVDLSDLEYMVLLATSPRRLS